MKLLSGTQIFSNVPFELAKNRKKAIFDLYVDNKIQEVIGDVYCPTCKNEKRVCVSINEISTTVKTAEPAVKCIRFVSENKSPH